MTPGTCYIVGKGPSVQLFDWPDDLHIMAVSGGIIAPPYMPMYWCGIDPPHCYSHWPWFLQSADCRKFTTETRFLREWAKYPNVERVPYGYIGPPNFKADGDIHHPNIGCQNSLFPAVQIAHRLGYKRLVFIGVDLLEQDMVPLADALREWYWPARLDGLIWETASTLSTLCEWMPLAEREIERLAV
jgi:hypothetical protein